MKVESMNSDTRFIEHALDCFVYKLRNNIFGLFGVLNKIKKDSNNAEDSEDSTSTSLVTNKHLKQLSILIQRQALITEMIFPTFSTLIDILYDSKKEIVHCKELIQSVFDVYKCELDNIKINCDNFCSDTYWIGYAKYFKSILFVLIGHFSVFMETDDELNVWCKKQNDKELIYINHSGRGYSDELLKDIQLVLNSPNMYNIKEMQNNNETLLDFVLIKHFAEYIDCHINAIDQNTIELMFDISNFFCKEEPESLQTETIGQNQPSFNFLIIDDDQFCLSALCDLLTSLGHTTHCFSDSIQGYSYFLEHHSEIDAIFMDLEMPLLSGNEIANRIYKYQKLYDDNKITKIFCLTGYESHSRRLHASPYIASFISKPITSLDLKKLIQDNFIQ